MENEQTPRKNDTPNERNAQSSSDVEKEPRQEAFDEPDDEELSFDLPRD